MIQAAQSLIATQGRYSSYFRAVNFSSQNEDWRTEAQALDLRAEDVVACVTGSGDRPLNLLAACAVDKMVAIDCDPVQNHLLELKVAAIASLDYADYLRFLGQHSAEGKWRTGIFAGLHDRLSPEAGAYWQAHGKDIEFGVLYCGRFERYFARIARLGWRMRPAALQRLFEFENLDDQRKFVRETWDNRFWRWSFRLLLHPLTSRLCYGDPAYFEHVAVPVGDFLYDRVLTYLDSHLARESFMLSLIFRGRLDDNNLPPYLTEAGHDILRVRSERLSIVTADLIQHFASLPARTYTKYSLSDVPSYLGQHELLNLLNAARFSATDDARIVIRQFLTRYPLPPHLLDVFPRQSALEARCERDDQALAYTFIIADVNPLASGSGDGVIVRPYQHSDNHSALSLERRCIQGKAYQLSFRRQTFHRRAENFGTHFIVVAEIDGELVGTQAVALKDATVFGEKMPITFFFDTRVDPRFRGRDIAKRMIVDAYRWAFQQADCGYLYTVSDNRIVRFLMYMGGTEEVGGYNYIVFPTFAPGVPSHAPRSATLDEVHQSMIATAGPFDFYCDPRQCPDLSPHVGSWMISAGEDHAGCSAWNNHEILAEVVERVPWSLGLLGWLTRHVDSLARRFPHIPSKGETVSSWYLFDFHASSPDLARDLIRFVAAQAREAGVDYCYIPAGSQNDWVNAVRAEVSAAFTPVIPYTLMAGWGRGHMPQMKNIYVDIRDL
jgi:S-adenosylmethionine-diacylglycerol 3-amino-3-carboxypropyl transferase